MIFCTFLYSALTDLTIGQPIEDEQVPSTSRTTIEQAPPSPEIDFGLVEDPGFVPSPRDPLHSSTDCTKGL